MHKGCYHFCTLCWCLWLYTLGFQSSPGKGYSSWLACLQSKDNGSHQEVCCMTDPVLKMYILVILISIFSHIIILNRAVASCLQMVSTKVTCISMQQGLGACFPRKFLQCFNQQATSNNYLNGLGSYRYAQKTLVTSELDASRRLGYTYFIAGACYSGTE